MASTSAIDGAIQKKKKMRERGIVRGEKAMTLVISNENTDNIIKIIKSLENSDILIDGVSETLIYEIKTKNVGFLVCY